MLTMIAHASMHVVRTRYSVLITCAAAIVCCSARSRRGCRRRRTPTPSEAISPKDDVIRLFDGKTLGDCYTWLKDTKREDPRKVFRVDDGMLHISGDGLGGTRHEQAISRLSPRARIQMGRAHVARSREQRPRLGPAGPQQRQATAATTAPGCRRSKCRSSKAASAISFRSPGTDEDGKPVPITLHVQRRPRPRRRSNLESRRPARNVPARQLEARQLVWPRSGLERRERTSAAREDKDSPHGEWTRHRRDLRRRSHRNVRQRHEGE